jgi:endonuclease G
MKNTITFILLLVWSLFGFSQITTSNNLPLGRNELIIEHSYYSLSYLSKYKQAEWVAYQISDSTAFGGYQRENNFKEDDKTNDIALKPFYTHSGYDRGHLCPAGSMAFNSIAMSESFFMTNMSPQVPGFNRGVWKKLESQVRTWGYENQQIFVVTGPVLNSFIDTIGAIPVPQYYYKVVVDYHEPEIKAIALLLENKSSSLPLMEFVVSIDSIEVLTGIDFNPNLPDSLENILEQKSYPELWSWRPIKVKTAKTTTSSYQCIAQTKSGTQCTRNVADSNSYCWQHLPTKTEQMVWVCGKSKIYHTSNTHRGLKRCKSGIKELTLTEALSLGLRKCKD